ncbi:hypothetical protein CVT24_005049 [Panaeolus cyanescens]|uniref:Uncharacterized protein n=1 Tax=Panaeolus cyanescens TaxID=181874 RepID=A0A409WYQ4_9AGAR|nr:hypothetical protein CVT24_005049 [Panaeolus cyanescens]
MSGPSTTNKKSGQQAATTVDSEELIGFLEDTFIHAMQPTSILSDLQDAMKKTKNHRGTLVKIWTQNSMKHDWLLRFIKEARHLLSEESNAAKYTKFREEWAAQLIPSARKNATPIQMPTEPAAPKITANPPQSNPHEPRETREAARSDVGKRHAVPTQGTSSSTSTNKDGETGASKGHRTRSKSLAAPPSSVQQAAQLEGGVSHVQPASGQHDSLEDGGRPPVTIPGGRLIAAAPTTVSQSATPDPPAAAVTGNVFHPRCERCERRSEAAEAEKGSERLVYCEERDSTGHACVSCHRMKVKCAFPSDIIPKAMSYANYSLMLHSIGKAAAALEASTASTEHADSATSATPIPSRGTKRGSSSNRRGGSRGGSTTGRQSRNTASASVSAKSADNSAPAFEEELNNIESRLRQLEDITTKNSNLIAQKSNRETMEDAIDRMDRADHYFEDTKAKLLKQLNSATEKANNAAQAIDKLSSHLSEIVDRVDSLQSEQAAFQSSLKELQDRLKGLDQLEQEMSKLRLEIMDGSTDTQSISEHGNNSGMGPTDDSDSQRSASLGPQHLIGSSQSIGPSPPRTESQELDRRNPSRGRQPFSVHFTPPGMGHQTDPSGRSSNQQVRDPSDSPTGRLPRSGR